jgi:hypothetical protein
MSLILDLSQESEAALASQARAARMPTERYVTHIVEKALEIHRRRANKHLEENLDSIAAQVLPDITSEEMETAIEEALAAARPQRSWHR